MFLQKTAVSISAVFLCTFLGLVPVARAQETSPSAATTTESPARESPEFVTLVAYNLKNYLAMERRVNGEIVPVAPKPPGEVSAVIEGLTAIGPDILGVSEIGDESFLRDLQSRLAESGISLPYSELVTDAGGWNRNIAVLSRFPITKRNSRADYTYELAGTKHVFQRGVLDVMIEVSASYHLRYIGLHLKSKREVPEGNQALMRLHEARLAREHIDRILTAAPETNLIVAGDMNELRHEPPLKTLQGTFGQPGYLTALTLADPFGFRWTHHWTYADSYARFDYILYSKGIAKEIDREKSGIHHWENWDRASDHRPLVVRIIPQNR